LTSPLILVTGATGYIASRLIPRLLDSGYRVRALARHPQRLAARSWFSKIDIVQADVTIPSSLTHAFDDVDIAYYLIHNMTAWHGYTALELQGARNFAIAAEDANIEHIIYLGGLADPEQHIAPHMRSRIETGKVLREGKVAVTEFRAGVIAGSGSISFEMIRFMTELFPIVPGPLWLKNRSQPIAIQNIIDYLFAALENKNGQGQVFEIGGPEITLYKDLMLRYARARGLKRRVLLLPGIPLWFMAFGVDLMTPVSYPIACALLGGLSADSIVKHPDALKVFPEVKLIDFDSATKDALEKTHPAHIERVWEDGDQKPKSIKHEGCFIQHRESLIHSSPQNMFRAITQVIKEYGWNVETKKQNSQIIICEGSHDFGDQWLEWRVDQSRLAQTAFFSPRGLPGFLYWYLLAPFHCSKFRGLIDEILMLSKNQ
jgi:uncharacterized protein YbjT (DUF2867 family)